MTFTELREKHRWTRKRNNSSDGKKLPIIAKLLNVTVDELLKSFTEQNKHR